MTRVQAPLWGQTMRKPDGWLVEVNGVPGPECFARRMARTDGTEVFTAGTATNLLWSWLRGGIVDGYLLRDLQSGD